MTSNDKLKQGIKELGDLRESIGAMRAKLAALEATLTEREMEVAALVESVRSAASASIPRARATTVPAQPTQPPVSSSSTVRSRPATKKLRAGSIAYRIVALLNGSPNRQFTTAEMAREFNIDIRQLYGSLSRLTLSSHISRVSDGVFRAVPKDR